MTHPAIINKSRRGFLGLVGLGSLAFLANRYFGKSSLDMGNIGQSGLKKFKVKETNGTLTFFNSLGNQLFIIHQDGELEIG